MRVRSLLILSVFCLGILGAEPVAKVGDRFIEAETLHLVQIAPNLSIESASSVRQQNTRALVSYLESYFTERYLEETGNPITEDEVEEKIDELLKQTYGSAGYTSDEYSKQIQQMAEIAELLTIYERSPEEAEIAYAERYSENLTASDWEQMKKSYSKAGLEEMKRIIEAPLPSEYQVRSAYRGQARAHVLNQKFSDVWGRTDIRYSDWRKKRFSQVEIFDADYFEIEKLSAWFGYDESSSQKESVKPVVSDMAITPLVEFIKQAPAVINTKPHDSPVEQSFNWWYWLIGTVFVIGGIVLFARKAK